MNVEFITAVNAAVTFTVGTSFYSAIHGAKFQNPVGQKITVPYPQTLFLIFYNNEGPGEFFITYSYTDEEPD